jgi:thiol:disulfide interchange protein
MKILAAMLVAAAPLMAQYGVKWEESLAAAQKRAKAEKKMIFMDIWAEWCGPCQHLKKNVFPTPEAQAALSRYVPFSALAEDKDRTPLPEGTALADRYRLQGYPTLIILDADGKELHRQVGAFRTGKDLAAWLGAK